VVAFTKLLAMWQILKSFFRFRFRQCADRTELAPIRIQDAWAILSLHRKPRFPEFIAQFGVNRFHNVPCLRRAGLEGVQQETASTERNRQVTLEEMFRYWVAHGRPICAIEAAAKGADKRKSYRQRW